MFDTLRCVQQQMEVLGVQLGEARATTAERVVGVQDKCDPARQTERWRTRQVWASCRPCPEWQSALDRWEEQVRAGRDRHFPDDHRLQTATCRARVAEVEATQALKCAGARMGGDVDEEALKVVEPLLTQQQVAMSEAHRALTADIMQALAGPRKAHVRETESEKRVEDHGRRR